jgi:hypothetical protein
VIVAEIWIPLPYREALMALARLPGETADRLVDALAALEAYSPVSRIQEVTTSVLGEGASPAERQLGLPLLALRGQYRQTSLEDIAKRVSESTEFELDSEERADLRSRAAAILATPVYATTAVATDLQTQNAHNYQSARIVTDLRPVFQDNVDDRPSGAVIVETLQLQTWTRDGESEAIFVAMDETDLEQLQATVERALHKTETLKKFLKEKDLAYFELEKGVADA